VGLTEGGLIEADGDLASDEPTATVLVHLAGVLGDEAAPSLPRWPSRSYPPPTLTDFRRDAREAIDSSFGRTRCSP
jgi:hypothetical protein